MNCFSELNNSSNISRMIVGVDGRSCSEENFRGPSGKIDVNALEICRSDDKNKNYVKKKKKETEETHKKKDVQIDWYTSPLKYIYIKYISLYIYSPWEVFKMFPSK